MNGTPFLFSINHNTQGFFNTNPQANILQTAFYWFSETLEVIFPEQALQEPSLSTWKTIQSSDPFFFIFSFLILYILSYYFLISADCRNKISAGQHMLPAKIFFMSPYFLAIFYCGLFFYIPNYLCH